MLPLLPLCARLCLHTALMCQFYVSQFLIQILFLYYLYRNRAVTAEQQLLLTLRFYASDAFLINVGELFGLHYSTASNIIKKMNIALARLRPQFIKMPSNAHDISDLQNRFYLRAKFPRCIGAIDCTHIKISSPGGDDAENYRNRKKFFSINVQTISDDKLMIQDIVTRWPGSSHIQPSFLTQQYLDV